MKHLLLVCLLLFYVPFLWPSELLSQTVKWSLYTPLMLLLPYGFTKSLIDLFQAQQNGIKKPLWYALQPAVFLLMLSHSLVSPLTYLHSNFALNALGVTATAQLELTNERSFQLLHDEDLAAREFAVQNFYQTYGQTLLYKNENGNIVLYKPTDEDIKNYDELHQARLGLNVTAEQVSHAFYRSLAFSSAILICFILVLLSTCIYELKLMRKSAVNLVPSN